MPTDESLNETEQNDEEGIVGFLDADGKWITITELADEFDYTHEQAREAVSELSDIGIVRCRRDGDGNPTTAQLTHFAVDLYEAEGVDEVVAAYVEHNKEPPMDVREEYMESLREERADG